MSVSVVQISTLMHDERVRIDPDALKTLIDECGGPEADEILERALAEVTHRLTELRRLTSIDAWPETAKLARSLVAIAEQVGMTRFAQVAADVARAARQRDAHAVAATLSRLERLADGSMMAFWDLQDMRI